MTTPLISHTWALRSNWTWKTGALFVTVGMMAGALGTHGLRRRPDITQDNLHAWDTATSFAIYNGLGLLLVSLHPRFSVHRFAAPAIAAGGAIFSSSIIAMVLARERFKVLGPVTPIGGILMIAGYVSLAL